eukprot:TRINITY_DN39151_c0_g1_i1.p1 TRINITY_DN39151_c0_g1~~TRINITY_DN39151_c0_g1_i1.p1  ORF type:complete len:282 (-),score=15.24 TRINITY_DN39151_c0_g1_i1:469-1314(-)
MTSLDSLISETVFSLLENIGVDIRHLSPVTKDLPFVNSPTPVLLSAVAYLVIVFLWSSWIRSSNLEPIKKDPALLRLLVLFHNLFLCGLSLYMGIGILIECWRNGFMLLGNPILPSQVKLGHLIYIFYISKLYEFMDTIIMLLKRNLRQVSYLHVYHHSTICLIWWMMAYRCPGGDAYFSALFNSWIHVAMYLYYLLAALIGKDEKRRKKYLFWGKYLTVMQMVQFASFIAQSVYGLLRPETYPVGVCRVLFVYSLSLLLFFCDFFFKKYGAPRPAKSKAQ